MAVKIIPGILEATTEELLFKVNLLNGLAPLIHIDIMDGKFVPETSAPIHEIVLPTASRYEAHLMVDHPEEYFDFFPAEQWQSIIMHAESIGVDQTELINQLLAQAKKKFEEVWLAFNPDSDFMPFCPLLQNKLVQLMGVYPGKSGQTLLPNTFERIKQAKGCFQQISMDGGARAENIEALALAGANKIICTSAIWSSPDPVQTYQQLQALTRLIS